MKVSDALEADTLAVTSFGSGIPLEALRDLAGLDRIHKLLPGTRVAEEGREPRELGLLLAGSVALSVNVLGRGDVAFMALEPGAITGWSAIVPPHVAMFTATVTERSRLVGFDAEALRVALRTDPVLAVYLYPRILRTVAHRLTAVKALLNDVYGLGSSEPW